MAKRYGHPSLHYRYEHYDPRWCGFAALSALPASGGEAALTNHCHFYWSP